MMRTALRRIEGKRGEFIARVQRFSKIFNSYTGGYDDTILLTNVSTTDGVEVTDHIWSIYHKTLRTGLEKLSIGEGQYFLFKTTPGRYKKVNEDFEEWEEDFCLKRIVPVRVITTEVFDDGEEVPVCGKRLEEVDDGNS